MAPSYQQLLAMSDEQLIAAHDGAAKHTVLGLNYYLDELRRRATDRQTQRMVELTEAIERLTRIVTLFTGVSVVLGAIALLVALTG
jgi:CHASE3 domain sensor protein